MKNCYILGRSKEDGGVVGVSATKKKDAIFSLPFFLLKKETTEKHSKNQNNRQT